MCRGRVTYPFLTLPPGHRGAEQLSSTKTSCQPTAQKWSQHTEGWKVIANSSSRIFSFSLLFVKQQKNQLTQWDQVELIVPTPHTPVFLSPVHSLLQEPCHLPHKHLGSKLRVKCSRNSLALFSLHKPLGNLRARSWHLLVAFPWCLMLSKYSEVITAWFPQSTLPHMASWDCHPCELQWKRPGSQGCMDEAVFHTPSWRFKNHASLGSQSTLKKAASLLALDPVSPANLTIASPWTQHPSVS